MMATDKCDVGYELETVEKNNDLKCLICFNLLRETMGTPCSHVFCRVCYQKLARLKDSEGAIFECPECRKRIRTCQIHRNTFADRLVSGLNVYCSQKKAGCEWIGTLALFYEQHKDTCSLQIVPCRYEGCSHSRIKRKIKWHETKCKYRIIQCEYCQAPISASAIDKHHSSCTEILCPCPQRDCIEVINKSKVQEHLDQDCKYVLVNCQYVKFGCLKKVFRKDIIQHNQASTNQHMALLCDQLSKAQTQIRVFKNASEEISKLENENNQLRNEVKDLREKSSFLTQCCPDFHLKEFLTRGVEKWIKKNENIIMEETYTEWYRKIINGMAESKLYQYYNAMFVKVKNENRRGICWSSNDKELHEKIVKGVYFRGGNSYVLRHHRNKLVIETQSLNDYDYNNSQALALHSFNGTESARFVGCAAKNCNFWCCAKLSGQFYTANFVIICLIKV